MNRFDPEIRSRVVRVTVGLLGVVVVSVLIGLSVGRPFSSSVASPEQVAQPSASAIPGLQPSATALPSPTPRPTPTPASLPATLAPVDGWLLRSSETFERVSTWPAQEQPGWASGYEDGRYKLKLDGQQTISYRIPLDSSEFRISVDVQVADGYAGIVFLANEAGALYRFQIDDAGRYRLSRRQGAGITPLLDWSASDALKRGPGAVNQIEVRRVENELSLYANQVKMAVFTLPADAKLQAQVGMTLDAVARDRVALAYFDNLVVRVPAVPSGS
jgi:hypothetical protein